MSTVTWPWPDPDLVVVAGDWHGNTTAVRRACQTAQTLQAPVVVQLGDFGMWPGPSGEKYIHAVSKQASDHNLTIAWIDGNHEDFTQLQQIPVSDDGLRWVAPGVAHLPRGSRWQWNQVRFTALGGATSLDKQDRTLGKSWWTEEAITDTELAAVAAGGHTDVLLTHDCPTGVDIPRISHRNYANAAASGWPISELERAWEHRDRVAQAVKATTPTHLWHGHYHTRYSATAALHENGDVHVEGLSWDGDSRDNSLMVARLKQGHVTIEGADKAVAAVRDNHHSNDSR